MHYGSDNFWSLDPAIEQVLIVSFHLLAFFIPITKPMLFIFIQCMLTAIFSHNKNQAASSTSNQIIMKYFSEFYHKRKKKAYELLPLKLRKCLGNAESSLWNLSLTSALVEVYQNCKKIEKVSREWSKLLSSLQTYIPAVSQNLLSWSSHQDAQISIKHAVFLCERAQMHKLILIFVLMQPLSKSNKK